MHMVLQLESSPFTQNNHYLSECRDKWLAKYKDARAGKQPAGRVNPVQASPVTSTAPPAFGLPSTPGSTSVFGAPIIGFGQRE